MKQQKLATIAPLTFCLAVGCAQPGDDFKQALPQADQILVNMPGTEASASGLSDGDYATSAGGLVGGAATYYTHSYYTARNLNSLGKSILDLVQNIARHPATEVAPERAVWGPFSQPLEPNEFKLTISRIQHLGSDAYVWAIEGKPKSARDYTGLASGAFAPRAAPYGKGWFGVDFNAIAALNGTAERGRIGYAYTINASGVRVLAHVEYNEGGVDLEVGYAYGKDPDDSGFILFALPVDIDNGNNGRVARENMLLRTRWAPDGRGRADVIATDGDLGPSVAHAIQCWDSTFVSRYEVTRIDGQTLSEDGDPIACRGRLATSAAPSVSEVPEEEDVENPIIVN